MAWTFNGVAFDWQPAAGGAAPTRPTWQRLPRLAVRPLLGLGDADISTVGYTPWKMTGAIYVTAANTAALLALNGQAAVLSDGTTTWTAVLELTTDTLLCSADGTIGQATFTRPRA